VARLQPRTGLAIKAGRDSDHNRCARPRGARRRQSLGGKPAGNKTRAMNPPPETVRHLPCTPGTKLGRLGAFNGGGCGELLRVTSQGDVRSSMAYPPSGAAAAKTPATSTARHGPYLLVRLRVRPERHRAQSCALALSISYLIYPVGAIHQIFTPTRACAEGSARRKPVPCVEWLFRWGEGTSSERSTSRQHPDLTL